MSATTAATSAASSGFMVKSVSRFTPKDVGDTPPDRMLTL
jgi:hypothetical protein